MTAWHMLFLFFRTPYEVGMGEETANERSDNFEGLSFVNVTFIEEISHSILLTCPSIFCHGRTQHSSHPKMQK